MKYYLEKNRVVIRGKQANGKPYRIFVKIDGNVLIVDPGQWDQKKQTVKGAPVIKKYLADLKVKLEGKVLENKLTNPTYDIPEAWAELFPTVREAKERLSSKVVECITPYLRDNSGSKSAGYLRHYTQLKTELTAWNKDLQFEHL